jgi:uncharacterized paraquat-inducible protein A
MRSSLPTTLGLLAVSSALLGLLALYGYGTFAARGLRAAAARDMVTAYRMASYAGGFSLAQLMLGVLAVVLGWAANVRRSGPLLALRLGTAAMGFGSIVILLTFLIVI